MNVLPAGKTNTARRAGKQSPLPTPVRPIGPDSLLLAILTLGLTGMIVLPTASAMVLSMAQASARRLAQPVDLTSRTIAFFLAAYGIWGFIFFTWSCIQYSISKGRSGAWGLLALPGALSLLLLAITGSPWCGLIGLIGVGGFLVPMGLDEDRLAVVGQVHESTARRGAVLFSALGIFIGASLAYGNSFAGGMTLDNKYIIEEFYKTLLRMDPTLDVSSWKMMGYIFGNDYWWPKGISGLYRPIATLSYWSNYVTNQLYGNDPLDPFQYHVVNFLLHWTAAFLGFLVMRKLVGRVWVAFFAASLFVTHPIATESVSNIIGRADIAAAIAVFAGLLLYIASTERQGAWKLPWLFAVLVVMAVGLFSKESAIALVGVVVAWDVVYRWSLDDLKLALPSLVAFCGIGAITAGVGLIIGQFGALGLSEGLIPVLWIFLVLCVGTGVGLGIVWSITWSRNATPLREKIWEPWLKFFLPYMAMLPPIVGWLWARGIVFANASPPETPFLDNPIRGLGFLGARMTACDVFLRLISLLVFPVKLSSDYSFNQIPLWNGKLGDSETWMAIIGLITALATLALVVVTFRRHKAICFLILFYLVVYLPTSNWLLIIGSIMAERFLYLPLLGFVGVVAIGFEALARRIVNPPALATDDATHPPRLSAPATIVAYSLLAVIAGLYSVRAWLRNEDWVSDVTLWTAAAKASPVSFRSYQSKAFALFEQYNARQQAGIYNHNIALRDHDIDEIYQTAEHAKPIVDILPPRENSSRLYLHLGMYYDTKGETLCVHTPDGSLQTTAEALPWFQKAEAVLQQGVVIDRTFNGVNREKEHARKIHNDSEIYDVGLPPIYFYLGNTYAHLNNWEKAMQSFQYMSHLDPSDAEAYVRVATVHMAMRHDEQAAVTLLQALMLNPNMTQLWPAISQSLAKINQTGRPAVTEAPGGKVQLHTELPIVRSVLCSVYQGLVRNFILGKRISFARQFAKAAAAPVEQGGWAFPAGLFDDIFRTVDPDTEAPVPPVPDESAPTR